MIESRSIDAGRLPHWKAATHRRILFADLLESERKNDAGRLEVLEELTREAQELGMGGKLPPFVSEL